MPKIKANSVPEHRQAQRTMLLAAAREIVLAEGFNALKFGDLADRAALARPSVYEYFKTKSDLAVALIREELPGWRDDVAAAMRGARDPEGSLRAFVTGVLQLVKSGKHELPFALAVADLDEDVRREVALAHAEIFGIVAPAIASLGVREVASCGELVGGVVSAAVNVFRRAHAPRGLAQVVASFVVGGVRALREQDR